MGHLRGFRGVRRQPHDQSHSSSLAVIRVPVVTPQSSLCARATVAAFYAALDARVVSLHLHTARGEAAFMALLCIPRLIFYVCRLALAPEYRSWSAVGCRLGPGDMASFITITAPFFIMTLPLLARLVVQHDALGIKYELAAQLIAFPPFVVWYFYGACEGRRAPLLRVHITRSAWAYRDRQVHRRGYH